MNEQQIEAIKQIIIDSLTIEAECISGYYGSAGCTKVSLLIDGNVFNEVYINNRI